MPDWVGGAVAPNLTAISERRLGALSDNALTPRSPDHCSLELRVVVSLADEYKRQFRWRDWPTAISALPPLAGMTVLDLGCGPGDLAATLVARGARVIGVDTNEDLVREAQIRGLPMAEFHVGDLGDKLNPDVQVDGIWCSFTAAFFPDLSKVLSRWVEYLKPDGWLAVTEVDDLFGHEPLAAATRTLLNAYAQDALAAGRYDFHMGRKLESQLMQAGLSVLKTFALVDQELSFDGRAQPEVLEAWRNRFARMDRLRGFCGERMRDVEEDFLKCLDSDDHRSLAKVYFCIASKLKLASI